jgi:DNA-binding transcriptional LysR family regulator
MPALSGSFVQQVTTAFLQRHPHAFCIVESRSSQRIMEWLVTRKFDVGLVEASVDNPYLVSDSLLEYPLVCIMPVGHTLAAKRVVRPADLDGVRYVSFRADGITGQRVGAMLAEQGAHPNVVLVASISSTVYEFVAAGHGVSLVHPMLVKEFGERLIVRPFEPAIPQDYRICRSRDSRNARLVEDFVAVAHETARRTLKETETYLKPGKASRSRQAIEAGK